MATYTTSASLQSQSALVSGVSENEITAGSATVAALVPEPNGTSVTYDGNTNLIISGINATLNGTYAYLPNVGFTRYSTGSNVYADYNEDYAVFYNDDGTNPRAVVFVSTPGTTKWLVSEYNVSATSWTDDALVGTKNQTGAFLNVNSVSAERPESGESSSTEEIFSGPSYVTGTAERKIDPVNVALTSSEVGVATVGGSVERQIDGELTTVDAQVSSTAGVSERVIVVANGDLTSDEVGVATVGGVVERQIDGELTAADAQVSNVSGIGERIVTFESFDVDGDGLFGELDAGPSSITATANIKRVARTNLTVADATVTVTGDSERKIDPIDINLVAGEVSVSSIGGIAERKIDAELTSADAQVASIDGVAERTIDAELTSADAQVASITGSGEREIGLAMVLDAPIDGNAEAGPSTVSGTSERSVSSAGTLEDQSVVVSGLAEREVPAPSGALHPGLSSIVVEANRSYTTSADLNDDDANIVGGQGERAVTLIVGEDASGQLRPTLYHLVTGEAERIITANGPLVTGDCVIVCDAGLLYNASGDLKPTDNHLVTGEGAVTKNATGELDNTESLVSGLAERKITGEGEFTASDCIASGIAERTVVEIEADLTADEVGVAAVTGDSERVIPANGAMKTTTSVVAGLGIRVSNGSGVLETDTSVVSGISERIITGAGDLVPTDNHLVSGLSEREIRSSVEIKPTDNNLVVGAGATTRTIEASLEAPEKFVFAVTVVERVATGALQAVRSVVAGAAENEVAAGAVAIRAGLSSVDAVTQVTRNGSGVLDSLADSVVAGISERIVTAVGTLQAQSSSTTGEAENIVPATGAIQSAASTIAGVAERTVVEIEADLTADEVGVVAISGDAERLITEDEAAPVAQPSIVTGLVERTVKGSGVLEDGSSTVVALAELSKTGTGTLDTIASEVTGVAERTINGSGVLDSTPSIVASVSERIITGAGDLVPTVNNLVNGLAEREAVAGTGVLQDTFCIVVAQANIGRVTSPNLKPTENLVTGLGERTIVLEEGIAQVNSDVSGIAERIIDTNDTTQALDTGLSEVTGVAERNITSTGALDTTVSVVDGLSERIVEDNNITAALAPTESLVDGLAERTINLFESPQAQPSTVVGEAERTVEDNNATHALVSGSSTLHSVAERIIENNDVTQAFKPTDNNLVTGLAERFVTKRFDSFMQAQPSTVGGLAERTIVLEEGIAQGSPSQVTGISERTIVEIEADLTADEVGVFAVTGESERLIPGNGALQDSPSVVDGLAERTINLQSGIDMPDDDFKVAGVAERIIENNEITQALTVTESLVNGVAERIIEVNTLNQALTTTESLVTGIAERTINTFSGVNLPDDVFKVSGVAERTVENNEITQALGVVDAEVDGLAERIIVIESSVDVKASDADVVTNGGTPITIDRHPIGGDVYPEYRSDLQSQQPDMVMDGDRKITQETDGLEDHAHYGPNSSDPNVSYTGPNDKILRISGIDANYDNDYELLFEGFTIATEDDGYKLTAYEEYNIYYWRNRSAGYNEYRICAYRTTNDTWAVFETTLNPELFFTDGLVIPDSIFTSRTVAFTSQSKNGPIKRFKSDVSSVSGIAENIHENYGDPSHLKTTPSIVVGQAFIGHNALVSDLTNVDAIVNGEGFRTAVDIEADLTADEVGVAAVTGESERLIVGDGVVKAESSIVSGLAENSITVDDGISQVSSSVVDGVGVRTSNSSGILITGSSKVESDAERVMLSSAVLESGSSHVTATVKRTVISLEADLHDESSSISSAAGDGERIVSVGKAKLHTTDSIVNGVVERTVIGSGETNKIESIVVGTAERTSKGSGVLDNSTDSTVDGTSERKIVSITANLTTTESVVVGVADKVIKVISGIHTPDDEMKVNGSADRTITNVEPIRFVCSDSKVEALVYTNVPAQDAMHTRRVFRIRKDAIRTIIVRQTPTRNTY